MNNHGSSTGSGSGNDVNIRLKQLTEGNTTTDVRLIAGTNVTLAHSTSNDTITISSTDTNTGVQNGDNPYFGHIELRRNDGNNYGGFIDFVKD